MQAKKDRIRLGGGSACPGERIEPAVELIEKGNIDYIGFDSLSEIEFISFEKHKMSHPTEGYDVFAERRLRAILPACARNQVKIVGNMGGANPKGAQDLAMAIAREFGLKGMKIAAVLGDDVLQTVGELNPEVTEINKRVDVFGEKLVSAHAYIPVDSVVEALREGADLIITGRLPDASLFLAPLIYEFDWRNDEWDLLARGTIIGHLLECAGQVTGGYFADPPYKIVPDLYRLGFPIAEVYPNGEAIITKVPDSGGLVTPATCTEQLLYETHDPSCYIDPDVICDFSNIQFEQVGRDRVKITGVIGKPEPELLKVNLGVREEGYIAEGMVFYGGPGALERAKLAVDVMKKRLYHITKLQAEEVRFDLMGVNALFASPSDMAGFASREVGVRIAARTKQKSEALKICDEIETIDNNGPASLGRSIRKEEIKEIIGYYTTFIPRDAVGTEILMEVA